jgi:hypothetical protein
MRSYGRRSPVLLPVVFVLVRFNDVIFAIFFLVFYYFFFFSFQFFGGGFLIRLDGAVV